MGQYYITVSKDKKRFTKPHDHDNGAKLMEHAYVGNNYTDYVMNLLRTEWYNTETVHVGDYADSGLYEIASETYSKESPIAEGGMIDSKNLVVINFTKMEFVRVSQSDEVEPLTINPALLLIADGNGQGGGDYYGDNEVLVGQWVGDKIGADTFDVIPLLQSDGFREVIIKFQEERSII